MEAEIKCKSILGSSPFLGKGILKGNLAFQDRESSTFLEKSIVYEFLTCKAILFLIGLT